MKHFQPTNKILSKYVDKIDLSPYSPRSGHIDDGKYRSKDKHDRATVEQILDSGTRLILFKFLQQGLVEEINKCISTGKEANVYYAKTNDNQHRSWFLKIEIDKSRENTDFDMDILDIIQERWFDCGQRKNIEISHGCTPMEFHVRNKVNDDSFYCFFPSCETINV